jgi:hypothetical protein
MPKSIFLSYVYEDRKHRDDIDQWAQQGKLGKDIVVTTERGDFRQQGEAAIRDHLTPLIRGSTAVIVLIGKDTHSHEWVRHELAVATSLKKKVILLRIPGTSGTAPPGFTHLPITTFDPSSLTKALD